MSTCVTARIASSCALAAIVATSEGRVNTRYREPGGSVGRLCVDSWLGMHTLRNRSMNSAPHTAVTTWYVLARRDSTRVLRYRPNSGTRRRSRLTPNDHAFDARLYRSLT